MGMRAAQAPSSIKRLVWSETLKPGGDFGGPLKSLDVLRKPENVHGCSSGPHWAQNMKLVRSARGLGDRKLLGERRERFMIITISYLSHHGTGDVRRKFQGSRLRKKGTKHPSPTRSTPPRFNYSLPSAKLLPDCRHM